MRAEHRERGDSDLLVDVSNLMVLQARPRLKDYLQQLWLRRAFIALEAKGKSFQTGRGTFLGRFWIFLTPVFDVAVYVLIFGVIMKASRGIENFVGFIILGVVFFRFFTLALNGSAGLVQRSKGLINSFNFPKASLSLSLVYRGLLENIPAAIIAVVGASLLQLDKGISFAVLGVIPLYFLLHLFILGVSLIVGRATAFIPDLKSVVSVLQRGLFFVSGVFFSIKRFEAHPTLTVIVESNPLYQFLQAVRTCVLDGKLPTSETWLTLTIWAVGISVIGFLYFWEAEARYANVR